MVPTAVKARTSFVIAAAAAVVVTALALAQRHPVQSDSCAPTPQTDDDEMRLTARLPWAKILPGARDQNLAITIIAPTARPRTRPPLSVAIVIDRSGSMNGVPMRNAKAAAAELVDQLDQADAFTIVTFSGGDEIVAPIGRATMANKAAARAAIERIWDDGGTCASCGLTTGAAHLRESPIAQGVRRIVLISDGQANVGIWQRDDLAQLASNIAATGASISTVGVGLDFDEVTMTRLADVGRGHYYFVEDTANLGAMFSRELGGLTETVASNVKLVIDSAPDVQIAEAYGYPLTRDGKHVIIPIADLRAGETRKVVLHVQIAAALGTRSFAAVTLDWQRIADGAARHTTADASVIVVDDPSAVAASIDRDAVRAVEQARAAIVLEQATATFQSQGYRAAQQVLRRQLDSVHANKDLDETTRQSLEGAAGDAIDSFGKSPAPKATKAARAKAYELAH